MARASGARVASVIGASCHRSVSTMKRARTCERVIAAKGSSLFSATSSMMPIHCSALAKSPRCRSPYWPQSIAWAVSATLSPGSHRSTAASYA